MTTEFSRIPIGFAIILVSVISVGGCTKNADLEQILDPQLESMGRDAEPVEANSASQRLPPWHVYSMYPELDPKNNLSEGEIQAHRRKRVGDVFGAVSDIDIPKGAHSFGRVTTKVPKQELREFYDKFHDSIDFNDSIRWKRTQLKTTGDSNYIEVDKMKFARGTKYISLTPRNLPDGYTNFDEVAYRFYFDLKNGNLWAVISGSYDD